MMRFSNGTTGFVNQDDDLTPNMIGGIGSPVNVDFGLEVGSELLEPAPIVSQGRLIQVVPAIEHLPPSLRQNCHDYLDALGALNSDEDVIGGAYSGNVRSQTISFPSRDHQQQPFFHFGRFDRAGFDSFDTDKSVNHSTTSSYSNESQVSTSQPRNSLANVGYSRYASNNNSKKSGNSLSLIMNSFGRST
jgi:hypothetical protein